MNDIWFAEFCGLFWGEGTFTLDILDNRHKGTCWSARARMRIIQREDAHETLAHIMDALGGHVTFHKSYRNGNVNGKFYQSNRAIVWGLQDKSVIEPILVRMQQVSLIPTKKKLEIPIMLEAIAVMKSRKYRYTDEHKAHLISLHNQLSEMRHFKALDRSSSG